MADNQTGKQKVQELTDKLERGLTELFNSDSYKKYLSTMSKFHNYSFNNTLLIAMQKPEASLVAGYKAWQKNFERHVNKGEKAIRILAPALYKIKEERDKIDPVTQEIMLDRDGNPQKEEVEITISAFRAVSVFDVSQTDGKPIPELEAKELLSDVEGYQDMIHAVEAVSPVPIEMEEIAGESKGYFDREARRIAVQENMSESQTLKTMIHEVAHSMLHNKEVEQENSDLDVVVEYTGSTREDDLFNMLHEDSIYIAGIKVDINPITEGRTGTLETYLPEEEIYLQEKAQQEQVNPQFVTQGWEQEPAEQTELANEPVIEPETVHVTFTVAECSEFHNMGEYHEGIETIEEAIQLYQAIDPSRMNGIPSIGVNMHIEGTEEWEDEQADILSGKYIDVDYLNYTPELRDTPKAQDALKKLIAAFPEKEVNDRETKEQKIQTLAAELDQLSYEIDTYGYRDSVSDREAQIQMIADDIRTGNVKPLSIFLQASIDEGIDEDSERQAKELLVRLAEYKPLAKIEELGSSKKCGNGCRRTGENLESG